LARLKRRAALESAFHYLLLETFDVNVRRCSQALALCDVALPHETDYLAASTFNLAGVSYAHRRHFNR
jgi:hypothetical protein